MEQRSAARGHQDKDIAALVIREHSSSKFLPEPTVCELGKAMSLGKALISHRRFCRTVGDIPLLQWLQATAQSRPAMWTRLSPYLPRLINL